MAVDRVRPLEDAPSRRVLLVAGEASGDVHGADFVRRLRARMRDVRVVGMGGAALRAAGLEPLVDDVADTAMVGVFEGWGGLRKLWRAYRTVDGEKSNFQMTRIAKPADIYPVFRRLFARQPATRTRK